MKFNTKDLKDMSKEEIAEYKKNRHHYIFNYLNVPTSENSLALRARALIEEERDAGIKPSIWSRT